MNQRLFLIAIGSVAVSLAVLGLKYLAYLMTGSIALYSDALESIVNVATAIATLLAIYLASRPANATLPYGYHKVEYFSAVMEGIFILAAALLIFREAWSGFTDPRPLEASWSGLGVNLGAGAINAVWCLVLLRAGRAAKSPAMLADGQHLLTDVLSSFGVLLGVGLAYLTGWPLLDPLLAALVAINILWSGFRLIGASVGGLMDVAVPDSTLTRIRDLIAEKGDGAIEAHDVRTRQAGRMTFIDFHLVVPGTMSVSAAHEICDRIEHGLRQEMGEATITIHVEPEEKAKHTGIVVI